MIVWQRIIRCTQSSVIFSYVFSISNDFRETFGKHRIRFVSIPRAGFDCSISVATASGAGEGSSLSWAPPLNAGDARAVLCWDDVGEANTRQDEHHGLQHLLVSPWETEDRDHRGSGRRRRILGAWRCLVEHDSFTGSGVVWCAGGGAGHGGFYFGFS